MSVQAMTWVLEYSAATHADRLVLLALANHAHADGTRAYPSTSTISHETALTKRQVQRSLRALERDGRIRATGKSKHGTIDYTVVLAGDRMSPRQAVAPTSAPRGGDISSLAGDELSPEPSVEPSDERGGGGGRAREAIEEMIANSDFDSWARRNFPDRGRQEIVDALVRWVDDQLALPGAECRGGPDPADLLPFLKAKPARRRAGPAEDDGPPPTTIAEFDERFRRRMRTHPRSRDAAHAHLLKLGVRPEHHDAGEWSVWVESARHLTQRDHIELRTRLRLAEQECAA